MLAGKFRWKDIYSDSAIPKTIIFFPWFVIKFSKPFIITYEAAKQIAQKINLELMCGYLWLFLTRSWSYAWMWIISAKSHWTILCFNFCSNRERIKTSKLRIWLSYALKKYLLIEKHLVILILLHGALQWLIAKKDQFQFQR